MGRHWKRMMPMMVDAKMDAYSEYRKRFWPKPDTSEWYQLCRYSASKLRRRKWPDIVSWACTD